MQYGCLSSFQLNQWRFLGFRTFDVDSTAFDLSQATGLTSFGARRPTHDAFSLNSTTTLEESGLNKTKLAIVVIPIVNTSDESYDS